AEPRNPAILVEIEGRELRVSRWLFANHPEFDMPHSTSAKAAADMSTSASGKDQEGKLSLRYRSAGGAHLQARPDGTKRDIRSYKSELQLLENGKVVREKTIEVNSPLSHRGYTLYQSGYNPEDLTWSTLQVVRDPGVPVVYAGFLCMIGGLILLLCFKSEARHDDAVV
ncbi:MAG: cytochrome c biogenesis protein ResB, partial [Lentisphaerae bacterium]|nr:cytochrome c biogenesis protein ResB [Lentisphaerota bacterium]